MNEYDATELAYKNGYSRGVEDTVWKMVERLKAKIADMEYIANTQRKTVRKEELLEQVNWVLHKVVPDTIDQIAKDMLEGL